jgi:hypothetical protein
MTTRQSRVVSLQGKLQSAAQVTDRQSSAVRDIEVVDDAFVQSFQTHFQGYDLNQEKVRAASILRNSLRRGSERQIEAILEMGRALIRAQGSFSQLEWTHLLEGGERILGIPKTRATMYRAIAENIDNGRLPRDVCPESYSSVYLLACLPDWQLKLGIQSGVIRPDVTRAELQSFRRLPPPATIEETNAPSQTNSSTILSLRHEESRLKLREARLLEEIEQVRTRLAEVRSRLADGRLPTGQDVPQGETNEEASDHLKG